MLVLITYDVSTLTPAGQKRLRKVAKICQNYGQRVQNSVFECVLDMSLFLVVKDKLLTTINPETDSIRFYMLGNNPKTEHHGSKPSFDVTKPLII
jgi:CRISPR-associated protein Cas2